MARYADIDVLLEHLTTSDEGNFRTSITQWLEMHQVEDVAPVTHAHWIKAFFPGSVECGIPILLDATCSNCNFKMWDLFPYCPQCGSIMDEEVE